MTFAHRYITFHAMFIILLSFSFILAQETTNFGGKCNTNFVFIFNRWIEANGQFEWTIDDNEINTSLLIQNNYKESE